MDSILDRLKQHSDNTIPMCMPGHKRNVSLPYAEYLSQLSAQLDATEVFGLDNLNMPEGIILESERLAEKLWGTRRSLYLVNGSTGGILAAVYAVIGRGDTVVIARNCHKSVYSALEITGADAFFIAPNPDGSVSAKAVELALSLHQNTRLLIITSPTYDGVMSDIAKIARVCEEHGTLFMVDEAHGAHLGLAGGIFGESAIHLGAHISVDSLHKTLPSLTGTAILHISKKIDDGMISRIESSSAMFMTSSPSYILTASIDGCVRLLCEHGDEILSRWYSLCEKFAQRCRSLHAISLMSGASRDKSKLFFDLSHTPYTGAELANILRCEYGIELEAAFPTSALAMTGAGDTEETLGALADAIMKIDGKTEICDSGKSVSLTPPIPSRAYSAGEARGALMKTLPIGSAEGIVSGEYIWAYPPGIPIIIPGEIFGDDTLSYMEKVLSCGISLYSNLRGNITGGGVLCAKK